MQEHYCDKCFRLIKIGTEHQDWCPKATPLFKDGYDVLKDSIFGDFINNDFNKKKQ